MWVRVRCLVNARRNAKELRKEGGGVEGQGRGLYGGGGEGERWQLRGFLLDACRSG